MEEKERFPLLPVITGFFVAALVLVPSLSSKFIAIGPFNLNGSTLIFPISFFFNDILTEVYGYEKSRRIIWTGFAAQIFAATSYAIVQHWPAAPFWHNQAGYDSVLGQAPRIVLASLTAYFIGEFINSFLLSKFKFAQGGKRGWAQAFRFVASTVVGQFFDTLIFMGVGFYSVMTMHDLVTTILTIWVFKCIYEVLALPFSLSFANWIKRREGVDHIDAPDTTRYSPFHF